MNIRLKLKVVGLLLIAVALVGCNTLDSMVGEALGSAVAGRSAGSTRNSQAPPEDSNSDSPFGAGDGSLMMLPPGAAFQIIHAQTTFFQGFGGDSADFEAGEGVHWRLVWSDGEGASDEAFTEHARLTAGEDGSWWYLKMESDDYAVEYEYFRQSDGMVVELKYRDSKMNSTRTAEVAVNLGAYEEDEEYVSFYEAVEADETGEYDVQRSSEQVSVPAGEFDAERVDVTGTDEDTGERMDITWWRVSSVPGKTVQFSFRGDEGDQYDGELMKYRSDYAPRL
ncbi:MAG: hypothetical protein WD492_03925 [Alkalispirochaeta sp.]